MTDPSAASAPANTESDKISLLALGSVLIRWRRLILALGLIGGVLGLTRGLSSARVYKSSATFIPQGATEPGVSSLASQFGLRMPTSGGGWGPPVYVELLRSRVLLEPLARDTFTIAEEGRRRVAMVDLLKITAPTPQQRIDYAVRKLERMVRADEDRKINAVKVAVTTEWPSVSYAIVERLVNSVNEFNLETRKSQATAEREFADEQAAQAERALRDAENRRRSFIEGNRTITGSAGLALERDRLERDVVLRQQVYTSLLQNREEARIREVRDTPVITVIERPRVAVVGEARNSVKKAIVGGLTWGVFGVFLAFLVDGLKALRRSPSREAREFFRLIDDATPRFLKRRR